MRVMRKPAELLRAAREGDPDALSDLLGLYRNYLRLLARTSLGPGLQAKADPSDIVQDALMNASCHLSQFRGETDAEFVAWLRQILANCLGGLRRRYLRDGRDVARERPIEEALHASSQALGDLLPARGSSPSHRAARRETGVLMADALATLPPDDREVIVLRNLQELEWSEVARRMGRSTEAARALWGRAFQRLGLSLEGKPWLIDG